MIISHLNVNFLQNKFEFLVWLVKDNIDILILSETKLDSSFPHAQFSIEGYSKLYRSDRDWNGEGLILFIREWLQSKLLPLKFNLGNKEYFLVEINLRKRKWLTVFLYNPHKTTISSYLKGIEKEIDSLSSQYENILLGDFNCELKVETLPAFCEVNFKVNFTKVSFQ